MIEIEKKFLLSDIQQQELLSGARKLGNKMVEDSYLDTDDFRLTTHDLWFRKRDGSYELKVPLKSTSDSNVATNRYHELTDIHEIASELGLNASQDFEAALLQAGIKKYMTCFTNRTSYEKRGFHLDIDTVTYLDSTFEYALAEIELLIDSESDADNAEHRIIEFAKEFNLVVDRVILGKVAAYLQAKRPEHYKALVAAAIFK